MIWLIVGSPLIILVGISLYLSRNTETTPPDTPISKNNGVDSDIATNTLSNAPHGGNDGYNS